MTSKKPLIHLIGIGGIGVSGLARWFLAHNWAISGSDLASTGITQELIKDGVKVKIGHKKANLPPGTRLVIFSQAVRPSNPELREARRRGIFILSYSQMLGRLTRMYKTIAIAGTHGKSTTTGFVSTILTRAGLDPTVIIGTKLRILGNRNFRNGKSDYLILEADEYKGAFWNYSPTLAAITNIDREHLDFYKNLKNVKGAFLKFIKNVRRGGELVLNADDPNLRSLKGQIDNIAKTNLIRVHWISIKNKNKYALRVKKHINLPGEHNLSNALAAFTLGKLLGISENKILAGISSYHGAWRRMEYRGTYHLPHTTYYLPVYDDYAHHPTEIRATLKAFKEKYPTRKLICVFQPHHTERLKNLFKDFLTAFDDADTTLILPVYKVAGRENEKSAVTSEMLVKAIRHREPHKPIFYLANPKNLRNAITTLLSAKSYKLKAVVVMMGAGDIANYTEFLILGR
ncbi:MAG: UDP-N-acetylmuramate--L-alanine ligase [Patescibacteria group bacterium]